jgi:endonuclease/exonuclease/phosphatase family metal-dependent hydrolase
MNRPLFAAMSIIALTAAANAQATVPLRVVTYNVKEGLGGVGSAQYIQAGKMVTNLDIDGGGPLRGLNPDIVLLQEMDQSNSLEIANFRNAYLPGYDLRSAGGDGFNYNATLVRPGITIVSHSGINVGGPRQVGKTRIRIAGAQRDVIIYNAHFKCCTDASSITQRTNNATQSGNNVSFELGTGTSYVVFAGDLNSANNSDNTITNLFASGVRNLPIESIAGAANPGVTNIVTFPSSGSRLDYICLDNNLAAPFDTDSNGTFTQAELNSMGFVYYSQDDAGLRSSGDTTVTNNVSDHRPIVFDLRIPRDPQLPVYALTDVNQSGSTTIEDLYVWELAYAQTVPPTPSPAPDTTGDRHVDPNDRAAIMTPLRNAEVADITTP